MDATKMLYSVTLVFSGDQEDIKVMLGVATEIANAHDTLVNFKHKGKEIKVHPKMTKTEINNIIFETKRQD